MVDLSKGYTDLTDILHKIKYGVRLALSQSLVVITMAKLMQDVERFLSVESLDSRLKPTNDRNKQSTEDAKREDAKREESSKTSGKPVILTQPSRWKSWEFRFYYLAFAIVVPLMFKAVMKASSESNVNYPKYAGMLSKGWIFWQKGW